MAAVLEEKPDTSRLQLVSSAAGPAAPAACYAVRAPAPPVWWPRSVAAAGSAGAGLPLRQPRPRSGGRRGGRPAGRSSSRRPGRRSAETPDGSRSTSPGGGGLLVLRRAFQPLYPATAEGKALPTLPVNLSLLGVQVPPGTHRVGCGLRWAGEAGGRGGAGGFSGGVGAGVAPAFGSLPPHVRRTQGEFGRARRAGARPSSTPGPLLILLLVAMLPLVRGTETLILRDVLNSHFPMKWSQAEALRHGHFPIIDPYRAGGQPLAGNLNAAPFYPDNLLVFLGSTFWAFNAHFWLHLLLAPVAFYWMARAWGLGRQASWAAAVCWTVSGFFLSHLNFYNLIAGVSLAPALVAACLDLVRRPGRRPWLAPGIALLWTLLILGGDPQTAALALLLAAAVALAWRAAAGGLGMECRSHCSARRSSAASLIALPQIVEFLRIFPVSLRGYVGYSAKSVTMSSLDPRQAAEWLIPFLFGRPDVIDKGSFWGMQFFTGVPPYYLSLYPGLLALMLIAASGRPRTRPADWAWGGIAFGALPFARPLQPGVRVALRARQVAPLSDQVLAAGGDRRGAPLRAGVRAAGLPTRKPAGSSAGSSSRWRWRSPGSGASSASRRGRRRPGSTSSSRGRRRSSPTSACAGPASLSSPWSSSPRWRSLCGSPAGRGRSAARC